MEIASHSFSEKIILGYYTAMQFSAYQDVE